LRICEDDKDMTERVLEDGSQEVFARLLTEGEDHFAQGRIVEALKCFAQIIKEAHNDSLRCLAFNNLGVVAHSMNELERAERMFMMALSIDPLDVDAVSNLSEIHKAKELQVSGVVEEPEVIEPDAQEMTKREETGDDRAVASDDSGDDIHEQNSMCDPYQEMNRLGEKLYLAGKAGGAIELFNQVVRAQAGDAPRCRALKNLGVIAHGAGDSKRAEKMLRSALDINPAYVDALLHLSDIYMEQERYGNALELLEKVAGLHPGHDGNLEKMERCRNELTGKRAAVQSQRPMFSIVVPTRQRHDTLYYVLRCLTQIEGDDFEIIVMDNNCSKETREVVDQIGSDNIRYFRSDVTLTMNDNWEKALSYVKGQYVTYVGDDDTLTHGSLAVAREFFKNNHEIEVLSWQPHTYWWPDTIYEPQRGMFYFNSSKNNLIKDSKHTLNEYINNPMNFGILPQTYNAFVSYQVIENVINKFGCYYYDIMTNNASPPDLVSGIINLLETNRYCLLGNALSIRGNSRHSGGTACWCGSRGKEVYQKNIKDLNLCLDKKWYDIFIPSRSLEINICLFYVRTINFLNQYYNYNIDLNTKSTINYTINRMINSLTRDPDNYENVVSDIKSLMKKHKIKDKEIDIPSKPPSLPYQKVRPFLTYNENANLLMGFDTNLMGYKNIEDVFWLVASLGR